MQSVRLRLRLLASSLVVLGLALAVGCASDPPAPAAPTPAAAPDTAPAATQASTGEPVPGGETPEVEAVPPTAPGPLARIVDSGRLRIGTSGEQPPLSMTAKNGELIGLDVAIGRVLATTMGVEAEFVPMAFGDLLDAVAEGEVDIVLSGVSITAGRNLKVEFAGPYYTSGKAILTKRPDLQAATSADGLDLENLTFAVLAGSTSESFAHTTLKGATILATPHLDQAIGLVLDGGADALIADRETCHYAVLRHSGQGLLEPLHSYTVEPMGVAISLDSPRLANLIDTYLEALEERGVLERTTRFWLKDDSWVGALR